MVRLIAGLVVTLAACSVGIADDNGSVLNAAYGEQSFDLSPATWPWPWPPPPWLFPSSNPAQRQTSDPSSHALNEPKIAERVLPLVPAPTPKPLRITHNEATFIRKQVVAILAGQGSDQMASAALLQADLLQLDEDKLSRLVAFGQAICTKTDCHSLSSDIVLILAESCLEKIRNLELIAASAPKEWEVLAEIAAFIALPVGIFSAWFQFLTHRRSEPWNISSKRAKRGADWESKYL